MGSESRLVDLCEEVVDCPHSTPRWTDSGETVLRSHNIRNGRLDLSNRSFTDEAHFRDRIRRAQPHEGDLVITREAPMGEVAMIPGGLRCCLGQRMVLLRPDPTKVDPRYLLYALQSPQLQYEIGLHDGTGSTVSNLRIPLLENLPIPTPALSEQRRIASTLGALDDKIELNRRMSQTLESMARALFKSWFVDFDPVHAKVAGLDPALPSQIADLFPASFKDSDIGPIPIGWDASTLSEMVEVNPSRTLRDGHLAPYLDMANAPTTGHSPGSVVDRVFRSGSRFINGDTLIARITPCLENGKASFVDFLPEGQVGWGSTEFLVLRPRSPLPPELAYCLARSEPFREYAIQNMSGTSGRQRVSADALSRYPLARPPESVAVAFGSASARLLGRAKLANDGANTLSEQRDALLPRLISGKRAGAA